MTEHDHDARMHAAEAEAHQLGYLVTVEATPSMPEPITHAAYAHPLVAAEQGSLGRFLCYGSSAAETVEAGLEIVRRHVKHGQPWPDEILRRPGSSRPPSESDPTE
jgi:hypothetical protein